MSTADDEKLPECDRRAYAKPLLVNHGSIADTTGLFKPEEDPRAPTALATFWIDSSPTWPPRRA